MCCQGQGAEHIDVCSLLLIVIRTLLFWPLSKVYKNIPSISRGSLILSSYLRFVYVYYKVYAQRRYVGILYADFSTFKSFGLNFGQFKRLKNSPVVPITSVENENPTASTFLCVPLVYVKIVQYTKQKSRVFFMREVTRWSTIFEMKTKTL